MPNVSMPHLLTPDRHFHAFSAAVLSKQRVRLPEKMRTGPNTFRRNGVLFLLLLHGEALNK